MRLFVAATLTALIFSTPAWADGAVALGYTSNGELVWGMQYGAKPEEIYDAATKALQTCQSRRSDCTELRLELRGNGGWFALAATDFMPGQRSPWGEFYSASKDTAVQKAVAQCEEKAGHHGHCKIALLKQNVPEMHWTVIPGTGNGGNSVPMNPFAQDEYNRRLYGTEHPGWQPVK